MKRSVSALLVASIFMTTTVPQGLQATSLVTRKAEMKSAKIADVFNKFRYDMTVEWDQQDPYFKAHAEKELENALEDLRAQGVSETEILSYVQSNLLDAKVKKEYDRLLAAMKDQGLSEEEASEKAMKFMEKNGKQGTSFLGGAGGSYKAVFIVVGVVIIGVVTYLVIKHCKKNSSTSSSTSSDTTSTTTSDTTTSTTSDTTTSTTSDTTTTTTSDTTTSTTGGDDTTTTTTTSSSSSDATSSTGGDCPEKPHKPHKPHKPKKPSKPEKPKKPHKKENNGWGNGDQDAPGKSCTKNGAENGGCFDGKGSSPSKDSYPGKSSHEGKNGKSGKNGKKWN